MLDTLSMMLSCQFQNVLLVQGSLCKLDDFENFVKERIGDVDFVKQCGVNSTYPSELTFYWDYKMSLTTLL